MKILKENLVEKNVYTVKMIRLAIPDIIKTSGISIKLKELRKIACTEISNPAINIPVNAACRKVNNTIQISCFST